MGTNDVSVCARFDRLGFDGKHIRMGIMGGTFDPIHIGHLACAEQAREAFALDAVIFIPTGIPAFKQDLRVTPGRVRLEMCRMAVASNPHFDVSTLEVAREGVTYTVDTLKVLRDYYPETVEFYFITGADAVCSILKWRGSAQLAQLARFIAVTRPGYTLSAEQREIIRKHGNFAINYLETTELNVSSTDLRRRVAEGKSIRYLTMQNVYDYIEEQGLYRD